MILWIYYEGYLSKKNLEPIINGLNHDDPKTILFSSSIFPPTEKLNGFKHVSIEAFYKKSSKGDKLLTGIGTPGNNEREMLRFCKEKKIKTVVIVSDLGFDPIKLKMNDRYIIPDLFIFPDKITTEKFVTTLGEINFISAGLPFLDQFLNLNKTKKVKSNSIGFFSVPIESDKKNWNWPIKYSNKILLNDLNSIINNSNFECVRVRKHPKELNEKNGKTHSSLTFESSNRQAIDNFILSNNLLISTYSTSLIIATLLKKPCCSYQPESNFIIREEIFKAIGIPILKNKSELTHFINSPNWPTTYNLEATIYNIGTATKFIFDNNILEL